MLDYEYWHQFETLHVWEIAALLARIDPRRMPDATDENGDALELADEIRMLKSAVSAGTLVAVPISAALDNRTEITVKSLLPWLRARGHHDLADGLQNPATETVMGTKWTPAKLAELESFRKTHGTKETSERFKISTARIRQLLPGGTEASGPTLEDCWNKRPL